MKQRLFRLTTGLAAAYHLVLGAALMVLPAGGVGSIAGLFLGMELEFDPQLSLIGKFVGSYILAFGVMLGMLCWNPIRLRALVVPALALFGGRLVNKLIFFSTIEATFGVTRERSFFAVASLLVIFVLMLMTRPTRGDSPEKL